MALESLQDAVSVSYAEDKVKNNFLFKDKNMVFSVNLKQVTQEGLQEELAVQRLMSQDDFRGNISGD